MISLDDFRKLELKIGRITAAERIEGSDKLLKLTVDLGTETRQIIAGIAKHYEPSALIGKQVPVLANLEPRMLMGLESQGMIVCADEDGKPVLLHPDREVPNGGNLS
ncbi:MAG: methionine--tRNA ligase subunit beta [Candidatus Sungbacteria bacterium]|nr:methionine--tRNA ligase subunit beta [Candidatus Sungbacteria bacterium]